MTGTGQLTGAREIVPVTWQMWLSSMDVSSWGGCRWAWKGSLRPVPADVVSLKQWGLLTGLVALAVWFIFPYLFCLDGRARRWGMYPPEDHGPSSVHLPPIQFLTVLHPVFTYLLVQPSKTLKILTLGRGDSIVLWLWGCEPCRLPWLWFVLTRTLASSLPRPSPMLLCFLLKYLSITYPCSVFRWSHRHLSTVHIGLLWGGGFIVFVLVRGRKLGRAVATWTGSLLLADNKRKNLLLRL